MIMEGHVTEIPQSDSQPLLLMTMGRSVTEKSNKTTWQRNPIWPSHRGTRREKEWDQKEQKKKMPRNKEGSGTE